MKYDLDATGKKLGRMASEIAVLLMGKNSPDFQKNQVADVKVIVTNASKLDIDPKKLEEKTYKTYSGYPGGLKVKNMSQVVAKKGFEEVIREAVHGMLPSNKLRSKMMKNLIISE